MSVLFNRPGQSRTLAGISTESDLALLLSSAKVTSESPFNYMHIESNQRSRQPGIVCFVGGVGRLMNLSVSIVDMFGPLSDHFDFQCRRNRRIIRIHQEWLYHTRYDGDVELTMVLMF